MQSDTEKYLERCHQDVKQAILDKSKQIIGEFFYEMDCNCDRECNCGDFSIETVIDYIHNSFDENVCADLDSNNLLNAIEFFAEEREVSFNLIDIGTVLWNEAAIAINSAAQEIAISKLHTLASFVEENQLSFRNLIPSNNFYGWIPHWGERYLEDCCIYQYRNLDNEQIHVDVYHFFGLGLNLHFKKLIDKSKVSEQENCFNAPRKTEKEKILEKFYEPFFCHSCNTLNYILKEMLGPFICKSCTS